jgi:hypothetical protein
VWYRQNAFSVLESPHFTQCAESEQVAPGQDGRTSCGTAARSELVDKHAPPKAHEHSEHPFLIGVYQKSWLIANHEVIEFGDSLAFEQVKELSSESE